MTPFRTDVSQAIASPPRRDDRFDFLRGIALLIIFIDHVPKNIFEPFTLHAVAFCDAAEMFFFISGCVAALVYGRLMEKKGFVAATKRVWRRAGVVYGAQLILLLAVVALAGIFLAATGDQNFRWIFRVFWVFENPLAYVIPTLTLHYQPAYGDILPCYVLLLVVFPLALLGLRRNIWLVLVPSFALWLAVQVFGLGLWTTSGERWFFNPFAWQFLFVLGALFGHPAQKGRMKFLDSPLLFGIAVALVAVIAVVQLSATLNTFVPAIPSLRPDSLPLDKTALQPLRLLSFFALAVVTYRYLPAAGTLSRYGSALLVIRCGRFSLQVFTFGALLSSFAVVSLILSGDNRLIQTLVCIAGVGLQLAYAAWRDRVRERGSPVRAPVGAPVAVRTYWRREDQ
jgi:hypothetical protein